MKWIHEMNIIKAKAGYIIFTLIATTLWRKSIPFTLLFFQYSTACFSLFSLRQLISTCKTSMKHFYKVMYSKSCSIWQARGDKFCFKMVKITKSDSIRKNSLSNFLGTEFLVKMYKL